MGFLTPDPEMVQTGYEALQRHSDQQETMISLLQQMATQSGEGLQTLAVSDNEVPAGIEVDFPVEGARRWIVPRLATGGAFAVPTSLVSLLEANNRRLGGTVVNKGENNVRLILASPQTAGSQQGLGEIWLRANGGSWDFRLGPLLWCGSLCAIAELGATICSVVEV
jgi:hypothetical protein